VQTFKIILTIFIVLLLQMLLPTYLPFFKYVDLPLVVTVYFGLQRAPMLGMLTGTALGLGGDRVAGGILGVGGFAKTLIGYLVAVASVPSRDRRPRYPKPKNNITRDTAGGGADYACRTRATIRGPLPMEKPAEEGS